MQKETNEKNRWGRRKWWRCERPQLLEEEEGQLTGGVEEGRWRGQQCKFWERDRTNGIMRSEVCGDQQQGTRERWEEWAVETEENEERQPARVRWFGMKAGRFEPMPCAVCCNDLLRRTDWTHGPHIEPNCSGSVCLNVLCARSKCLLYTRMGEAMTFLIICFPIRKRKDMIWTVPIAKPCTRGAKKKCLVDLFVCLFVFFQVFLFISNISHAYKRSKWYTKEWNTKAYEK